MTSSNERALQRAKKAAFVRYMKWEHLLFAEAGQMRSPNELREEFATKFSYHDLTFGNLLRLQDMLVIELALHNLFSGHTFMSIPEGGVGPYLEVRYEESSNYIKSAFLRVDGQHFKRREAISFNADGFIGFCGWADSVNSVPFSRAFSAWLHDLEKRHAKLKAVAEE